MRHLIRPLARRTAIAAVLVHARARARADRIRRPLGTRPRGCGRDTGPRPGDPYGHRSPLDGSDYSPVDGALAGHRDHPASLAVRRRLCVGGGDARSRHGDRGDVRRARVCQPGATRWPASTRVIPRVVGSGRPRVRTPGTPTRQSRSGRHTRASSRSPPCTRRRWSRTADRAPTGSSMRTSPARRRATAVRGGRGARRRAPRTYRGDDHVLRRRSPRGLEQPPGRLGRIFARSRCHPGCAVPESARLSSNTASSEPATSARKRSGSTQSRCSPTP